MEKGELALAAAVCESVTFNEKLYAPAAVGVPVISAWLLVVVTVKPVGKLPDKMLHV